MTKITWARPLDRWHDEKRISHAFRDHAAKPCCGAAYYAFGQHESGPVPGDACKRCAAAVARASLPVNVWRLAENGDGNRARLAYKWCRKSAPPEGEACPVTVKGCAVATEHRGFCQDRGRSPVGSASSGRIGCSP